MDVFKVSANRTKKAEINMRRTSILVTFKKSARKIARIAAEKWILIFFSVFVANIIPSIAALKDSKRFCGTSFIILYIKNSAYISYLYRSRSRLNLIYAPRHEHTRKDEEYRGLLITQVLCRIRFCNIFLCPRQKRPNRISPKNAYIL